MAGTDPVDTHGHDVDDAKAQEPLLNENATPASTTQPTTEPMVLAQSAAEVTAQMVNAVGES